MGKKGNRKYIFMLLLSVVAAFFVGYFHHSWYYPLYFHGDAAAMQVLAKSILDEGALLPVDFAYGNQLVLFRSSGFIALASYFGLAGYDAFVVGSALAVACWGGLLHFILSVYFQSSSKGFLFTILMVIPLGWWESDFVLGQQSHLSNVVLALGIMVFFQRWVFEKSWLFLAVACFCLFLMSFEAPIRGLLVLFPALVVVALSSSFRRFLVLSAVSVSTFILAYCINGLLIGWRPVAVDYFDTLDFKSINQIFENMLLTTSETIASVSSLDAVTGQSISALGFVVFSLGLLLLIAYFGFIFSGAATLARVGLSKLENPAEYWATSGVACGKFVFLTAVMGVIVGVLAVSALNPDSSRHYLWAIFAMKLVILTCLHSLISNVLNRYWSAGVMLAISLVLSAWFANVVANGWDTEELISSRVSSSERDHIARISRETGIKNIYGEDFWKMMPLNSAIDDFNAQALLYDNGQIVPYIWLTRPSWVCAEEEVLYFLRYGDVDREIAARLTASGGKEVHQGDGYAIWTGPRVWIIPHAVKCYASSLSKKGGSLLMLPSQVGKPGSGARQTDGRSGYLVYGPYADLRAGIYQLDVYGSAAQAGEAHVDIVSSEGTVTYARFDVKSGSEGFLVKAEEVQLRSDISGAEIRVWVSEGASLELTGYRFSDVAEYHPDHSGQSAPSGRDEAGAFTR